MKFGLRTALIACALALPSAALAAPPAVTGVDAELDGNNINVKWDKSEDEKVINYQIYFSGESILKNAGLYDDYEVTEGDETEYVFLAPPRIKKVYIAILAVDYNGEESETFESEVMVDLSELNDPGRKRPPPPEPEEEELLPEYDADADAGSETESFGLEFMNDGNLHLLSAEVNSPTEVVLIFSNPVTVPKEQAPKAFKIVDPKGKTLPIMSIVISREIITVNTQTQERGVSYQVQLSEPLAGEPDLPLDDLDRTQFFTGHPQGDAPKVEAPPPPPPKPTQPYDPFKPFDVTDLTIEPAPLGNGAYAATVKWKLDNFYGDIQYIIVFQTINQGMSWSEPQILPASMGGFQTAGLMPGEWGIVVHTLNANGHFSQGAFKAIQLPVYFPGGYQMYPGMMQGYPFGGNVLAYTQKHYGESGRGGLEPITIEFPTEVEPPAQEPEEAVEEVTTPAQAQVTAPTAQLAPETPKKTINKERVTTVGSTIILIGLIAIWIFAQWKKSQAKKRKKDTAMSSKFEITETEGE